MCVHREYVCVQWVCVHAVGMCACSGHVCAQWVCVHAVGMCVHSGYVCVCAGVCGDYLIRVLGVELRWGLWKSIRYS